MKDIPFYKPSIDENELEHIKQVLDVKKESSKVLEFEESIANFVEQKRLLRRVILHRLFI